MAFSSVIKIFTESPVFTWGKMAVYRRCLSKQIGKAILL
jgi:hypothetical protein